MNVDSSCIHLIIHFLEIMCQVPTATQHGPWDVEASRFRVYPLWNQYKGSVKGWLFNRATRQPFSWSSKWKPKLKTNCMSTASGQVHLAFRPFAPPSYPQSRPQTQWQSYRPGGLLNIFSCRNSRGAKMVTAVIITLPWVPSQCLALGQGWQHSLKGLIRPVKSFILALRRQLLLALEI